MTTRLDPALFPGLIEHFSEQSVVYCHACKHVCFPSELDQHLYRKHGLSMKQRQPVVDHCQTLPVALAADALAPGRDNSLPVPFLPILEGFACNYCRFYTINRKAVRAHLNQAHLLQRQACTGRYRPVQLQSWYTEKRAKY